MIYTGDLVHGLNRRMNRRGTASTPNAVSPSELLRSSDSKILLRRIKRHACSSRYSSCRLGLLHYVAFLAVVLSVAVSLFTSLRVNHRKHEYQGVSTSNDLPKAQFISKVSGEKPRLQLHEGDVGGLRGFDAMVGAMSELKHNEGLSRGLEKHNTNHLPGHFRQHHTYHGQQRSGDQRHERPRHSDRPALVKSHFRVQVENNMLMELPKTAWMHEKHLVNFKPSQQRTTDVQLISLRNACYCTQRNKFLVPRRSKAGMRKFPDFLYKYGEAKGVPWEKPKSLLAFPNQKTVRISGSTILWKGRSLHLYHAHLQGSLIPIRSLLDILKRIRPNSLIRLASEAFLNHPKTDIRVSKLHDYYLGDIPESERLELRRMRSRLLCFDEVLSLGTEFENHVASVESFNHIKALIEKTESDILKNPLVRSCKDASANKETIWIMNGQQEGESYGSINNIAAVRLAVDHELTKTGLADQLNIRVIHTHGLAGPLQNLTEGCIYSNCSDPRACSEMCTPSKCVLQQVMAFNNMSFLISTSGPETNGVVYMPTGSQVIEIVPYGVFDHSQGAVAREAKLKYTRMANRRNEQNEKELYERFGDIASLARTCWADSECRRVRLKQATQVNVHQLRLVLRKTLRKWQKTCL